MSTHSHHTYRVSESKEELNPATQFRQLYDQEYRSVYRSIRAVVLDASAAEDLTQETFVRAYRARDRYTPTAPPGAWLRRRILPVPTPKGLRNDGGKLP